jgi:hypothetical protein
MSKEIKIQYEIRYMAIMKNTIKEMGLNYDEINENQVECRLPHGRVIINSETGQIRYDNMDEIAVNAIKQNYQVNFYKDRAIREGMKLKQEVKANGEIHLYLTR